MQIRTYDEVEPAEVYQLTMIAFGWPLTPDYVRVSLEKDTRVLDGFALYAVVEGQVVAQTIPLRIPVRLTSGVETVGGIAGVCTHPHSWGKGYARALMERAHNIFRDLGLRMSTLTTSPNIRGYGIYRRMGYVDLAPYYFGLRAHPGSQSKPTDVTIRKAAMRDLPLVHSLYERYVKGLYGWSERNPGYLEVVFTRDKSQLHPLRVVEKDGRAVGYLFSTPGERVFAYEILVDDSDACLSAVRSLESKEKRELVSLGAVSSEKDMKQYRSMDYRLYGPTLGTVMAMPLVSDLPAEDIPDLFGVPQGRFILHPTDWF